MEIIFTWLVSFALAGIIISPFFWLRFLKEKNVWKYIFWSSAVTLLFFWLYIFYGYDFISNWTAKTNADLYYFFYDVIQYAIYIVLLCIVFSPFIFTKIIKQKFTVWRFLFLTLISLVIFVSIFTYWAFILLPQAFSHLHDYL
jgi:hypothetical protein